jgi:hypothetical protein
MNGKYFSAEHGADDSSVGVGATVALAQKSLEIPSGTVRVRMIDNLSSEQTQMGDTFRGTLDEPSR